MSEVCSQDRRKRVAMLHYHLEPGGVTTVLAHAADALQDLAPDWEIVVISGRPAHGLGSLEPLVQTVRALDYSDETSERSGEPEDLADALEEAARRGLGGFLPDLWHVHNHSLGKNALLPDALAALLARGQRLLLQIHDFAEDGRPSNFRVLQEARSPYPLVAAAHYATINSRDRQILERAGIAKERLHDLPNPVAMPSEDVSPKREVRGLGGDASECLLLYLTRGIRRKNMGEVLLLALLGRGRWKIASTRRPDNAEWQAVHADWETFSEELDLSLALAVVGRLAPQDMGFGGESSSSFQAWLDTAQGFITTSVAEGFGLTYIEALWKGTPLLGRDLPEITADFKRVGLTFPGLYEAVRVPLDWVGRAHLLGRLGEELQSVYQRYEVPLPEDAAERALDAMTDEASRVDFGRLDEPMQRRVLRRLVEKEGTRQVVIQRGGKMLEVATWLAEVQSYLRSETRSQESAAILQDVYSRNTYGRRLLTCYASVLGAKKTSSSDHLPTGLDVRSRLVATFLSPERFHFLRS